MEVPCKVWEVIREFLPCNPVLYLRVSGVCRSAKAVFCSDEAWARINPYRVERGVYEHFIITKTVLNPSQRRGLCEVWDFVCGIVGVDTVLYRLHKGTLAPVDAGENLYYCLGVLLCTSGLLGQPRVTAGAVEPDLVAMAVELDPGAARGCAREGGASPARSPPRSPPLVASLLTNGMLLEECSLEQRGDRLLVSAAVASNGRALRFASEELRQDMDMVLRARCSRVSVVEEETYSDPFYDQLGGDPYLEIVNEMNRRMGLEEIPGALEYFEMRV